MLRKLSLLIWSLISFTHPLKFFIYNWPDKVTNTYPSRSIPLTSIRGKGNTYLYRTHNYANNKGFGDMIIPEDGVFNTFAIALYKVIIARLYHHPYRTYNQSEADLFFIPFDIGFNAIISKETGRSVSPVWSGCDIAPFAQVLLERNMNSTSVKMYGYDHFLIHDINVAHHMDESCYRFFSKCLNCSVLSIETMLYETPYTKWLASERNHTVGRRWQGVPYASAIHWHEKMKQLPWTSNRWKDVRVGLCVFWGDGKMQWRHSTRLRTVITNQISNSNSNNSNNNKTQSGNKKCSRYGPIGGRSGYHLSAFDFKVYMNHTFCLHPAGDTETRKGIFDSLLLGCIPVLFSPDLLYKVYSWHFTLEESRNISVYIPANDVISNVTNVVDFLANISDSEISIKQAAIERIAPRLQYSMPPTSLPSPPPFNASGLVESWSPPFRDAVDVILDRLGERVEHYKASGALMQSEKPVLKSLWDAVYGVE